ncbi:MAG TPA: dethiobiotin synthase, partial [Polyangiaceae bacterium]|nr:dethiobiotin synthase [Polyangiaceae bacterium]
FFLVESAGASFSPLSSQETNFDLALRLEPAIWILVAPDSLGVLHDLTTTLALMRERGRLPDYVVLNQARPPDASTGTNAEELSRLRIAQPELVVRRDSADLAAFAERLSRHA